MTTTGLVADDLTGANDAAVHFARQGWNVHLLISPGSVPEVMPTGTPLYATTTGARAAAPAVAERITAKALRDAAGRGAGRFYLKIDSTVRGSIAAQVRGSLKALAGLGHDAAAVLCPAYPSMGRSLRNAVLEVQGVPVAKTSLHDDPVTPVLHSDLRDAIPGARLIGSGARGAVALRSAFEGAYAAGERLLVVDAVTDDDLAELARAIASCNLPLLPVGSAGLAAAVARTWTHQSAPPIFPLPTKARGDSQIVQVSSLNPISLGQVSRLDSHGGFSVTTIEPPVSALTSPDHTFCWLQNLQRARSPAQAKSLTLVKTPPDRAALHDPHRMATGLAEITAALLRTGDFNAAGLIGGDGALAALRALNCPSLRVHGSLAEGVPLAITAGGDVPELPVFTKAGGFGHEDSLIRAIASLNVSLNRSTQ